MECVDELEGYRSPLRVLVRFFKRSRDRWKAKYLKLQRDLKRFKNNSYHLRKAKEQLQQEVQASAARIEALRAEIEQMRAQLSDSSSSAANESKKRLLLLR